ncbi:hypothetical protein D3C81_531420 [compost metagenome]
MNKSKCDWFGHRYQRKNDTWPEPGLWEEVCVRCGHQHTRMEGYEPMTQPFINSVMKFVIPLLLGGIIIYVCTR